MKTNFARRLSQPPFRENTFRRSGTPYAAQTIFALALPHLYILPLDLTSYLVLPFSLYPCKWN
jgi:hypothetical protein